MSYKKDLAAIKKYGNALQFIENQTPELCLEAVKFFGLALEYVKEQTFEICMAAVQQDGFALKYVKEQTEDICLAAVQQDGWALKYVQDKTPAICFAAVREDWSALQFVKDFTSIASLIDEEIIQEGLESFDSVVVEAYRKIVKIREAYAIASRITSEVNDFQYEKTKFKL